MRVWIFGATSAIAQATARIYAAQGAELYLVARNAQRLQAVAEDLRTRGAARVETGAADLDDLAQHEALVSRGEAVLGAPHLVLLAHGVLGEAAVSDARPDVAQAILHTNLVSPVALLTLLAQRAAPGATLAAISSVAGDRGRAKNGVYGASKAGLDAFLSALRQRLARKNVHVLTIKPGFVDTPMTAGEKKNALFATPDAVGRGIVRAVARGRDVVYLPWFWGGIMAVIRAVPERIFKRMSF